MFDSIYGVSSVFDTGSLVRHVSGLSGVVVKAYYDEMAGQFMYVVRVPSVPAPYPVWGEDTVTASTDASAVVVGDMVLAVAYDGSHDLGQVQATLPNGKLIVRFADGIFLVGAARVVRAIPVSFVRRAQMEMVA